MTFNLNELTMYFAGFILEPVVVRLPVHLRANADLAAAGREHADERHRGRFGKPATTGTKATTLVVTNYSKSYHRVKFGLIAGLLQDGLWWLLITQNVSPRQV